MAGVDETNEARRVKRMADPSPGQVVFMDSGDFPETPKESLNYRPHIEPLAKNDAEVVVEKDKQYGASWCKRGGTGAYHVFIRKFDRLEEWTKKFQYDMWQAIREDNRPEGIIDDIRDIRGYLLLIEAYAIENGMVTPRYRQEFKIDQCNKYTRWSEKAGPMRSRCVLNLGHPGHCEMIGQEPDPDALANRQVNHVLVPTPDPQQCLLEFDGTKMYCELPAGHDGMHHTSGGEADETIDWNHISPYIFSSRRLDRCPYRFFNDPSKQCQNAKGHTAVHTWGHHKAPLEGK